MTSALDTFDHLNLLMTVTIPSWLEICHNAIVMFAIENRIIFGLFIAFIMAVLTSLSGLLAYRMPRIYGIDFTGEIKKVDGLSLFGKSHCESCHHQLSLWDIFPILGLLSSKFRCRYCGEKISLKYPIIEALVAFISFLIWIKFDYSMTTLSLLIILFFTVVISWVDYESLWIPDSLSFPFISAGLLFSPFCPNPENRIIGAVAGGACLWTLMKIVSLKNKVDLVSFGDVLLFAGGMAWLGVSNITTFMLAASITGAILSIFMIAFGKKNWEIEGEKGFPFGPGIMIGLFLTCSFLGLG